MFSFYEAFLQYFFFMLFIKLKLFSRKKIVLVITEMSATGHSTTLKSLTFFRLKTSVDFLEDNMGPVISLDNHN